MKAWKNLIFIFIAYSITLTHMLVPHQHEQAPSGQYIAQLQGPGCSTSLVGFLQIFFSADLGSDHLENFKKSFVHYPDFSFAGILLYSALAALLALPLLGLRTKPVAEFIEKLRQRLLLFSSKPLRAPPAFA